MGSRIGWDGSEMNVGYEQSKIGSFVQYWC